MATAERPKRQKIADTKGLLKILSLAEIRFYELSATADDEVEPNTDAEAAPLDVSTAVRLRDDGIDYRVALELPRPTGRIRVDAAAMYSASRPFRAPDAVIADFGTNVAIMTVFPYLRQAISELARRVGDDLLLPILPRGGIAFTIEATREVPEDTAGGGTSDADDQGDSGSTGG